MLCFQVYLSFVKFLLLICIFSLLSFILIIKSFTSCNSSYFLHTSLPSQLYVLSYSLSKEIPKPHISKNENKQAKDQQDKNMAKQKLHTNTIELDLYYQLLLGVAPALECSQYIQDYFIGEKLTHLSLQVSIANSLFFWGSILCALPLLSVGTLFGLDLHRSYGCCTVSGVHCTSVVFCLEDTVSLQSVHLLQLSSPYHLSPLLPRSLSLG